MFDWTLLPTKRLLTIIAQMFGNIPRSIEYAAQWVSDILEWARDNNVSYIEATEKGMEEWTQHVHDCGQGLLANEVGRYNARQLKRGIAPKTLANTAVCLI